MRVNGKKIIQRLEALYPLRLAESWDNVGLQIGSDSRVVERILVCLEVTEQVVEEAISKNIDLIIAHHPLIFKGLKTLAENTPQGKLISKLIRENMLVYCMHTNFDTASGGLNDILALRIGLDQVVPLNTVHSDKLYKLSVYIPKDVVEKVSRALYAAGAGRLGNYDSCGFRTNGIGSFRPLEGSAPSVGAIGEIEEVSEIKLDTVVSQEHLNDVLQSLLRTHPYETPAYDLFELKTPSKTYGLGRVGQLKEVLSVDAFVDSLKESLGVSGIRYVQPNALKKFVKKVAVVSGAGMDYVKDAAKHGVDVFVTGDIKYHEARESAHLGMVLIDVGHFESEVIYKYHLKDVLDTIIKDQEYDVVVETSTDEAPTFLFA